MRTTLTLDDDVAARIRRLLKLRKGSLKEIVNETLRAGFAKLEEESGARKPYRLEPFRGGKLLVSNLDCVAAVLEDVEGPSWK